MGNITSLVNLRTILDNLFPTQADARRIIVDAALNSTYIQLNDKVRLNILAKGQMYADI